MSKESGSLRQKVEDMDKKLDKAIELLTPVSELTRDNANDIKWIIRLGSIGLVLAGLCGAVTGYLRGATNGHDANPAAESR